MQAQALHGNPYDGHTLAAALEDIRKIVGRAPQRGAVDQGYKGHRIALPHTAIYITGQKRGVTQKIKRWLKRRAVVEPVIGHAKNDGLLGRNWLHGRTGDRSNALLAASGFNLRQLLRFLKRTELFFALVPAGTARQLCCSCHLCFATVARSRLFDPQCSELCRKLFVRSNS